MGVDAAILLQLLGGLAVTALLLVIWQGFNMCTRHQYRHIPGPRPSWLLGNVGSIVHDFDTFLPEALQHWGTLYGPVFKFFTGWEPMVVISDADLVRTLCTQHQQHCTDRTTFHPPMTKTQHKMAVQGILWAEGEFGHSLRAALQPMFHSTGLQSYMGLMNTAAVQHRDVLKEAACTGEAVDISQTWCNFTLKVIAESAFGVEFDTMHPAGDPGAQEHILSHAVRTVSELSVLCLNIMVLTPPLLRPLAYELLKRQPRLVPQLQRLHQAYARMHMMGLVLARNLAKQLGVEWADREHMEEELMRSERAKRVYSMYSGSLPSKGSLVHTLLTAKSKATGQPLTPLQIVAQLTNILMAGNDTTAFLMTSFMYQMAQHPAAQARVLQEIDAFGRDREVAYQDLDGFPYLEAAINECLRLMPPGPITTRKCTADIVLDHMRIPKGSSVMINIYGLHRDPRYWSEPEAFRPERMLEDAPEAENRHPYSFAPFGVGARKCQGYKFAMQEAKVALCRLYQQYTCELADAQKVPAQLSFGIATGFKKGMKVTVLPRQQRRVCLRGRCWAP